MPSPLNILLVGGESAGVQTLKLLNDSPHNITAVLAEPHRETRYSPLWKAAKKQDLDCIPAEQIRLPEFAPTLLNRDIDVLLNVHSLYLVPAEVLDACRIGAYNLHPGPLPEYAGLDVPSWAIYHGQTTHAVTLHQMVSVVDAGFIAYQEQFDVSPTDTGLTVMSRCVRLGLPLITTLLNDLFHDPASVPRMPQDHSKRQYFCRKAPNGGWLDWYRPAQHIVNHIRAADYSPFPSPWGHPVSVCEGKRVGLVNATVTAASTTSAPGTISQKTDSGILVAASDLWIDVQLVELDDRILPAADVLTAGSILVGQQTSNLADISKPVAVMPQPG